MVVEKDTPAKLIKKSKMSKQSSGLFQPENIFNTDGGKYKKTFNSKNKFKDEATDFFSESSGSESENDNEYKNNNGNGSRSESENESENEGESLTGSSTDEVRTCYRYYIAMNNF